MIDAYLNFGPQLKGECRAPGRAGWLEIEDWGFGVRLGDGGPGATKVGGSRGDDDRDAKYFSSAHGIKLGGAKPSFSLLKFSKEVDRASPNLMLACATARSFKEVVLEQVKAGMEIKADGKDASRPFLRIVLSEVHVAAYQAKSGKEHPEDEFELSFQKIRYSYCEQLDNGSLGASVDVEYQLSDIGLAPNAPPPPQMGRARP